MSSEMQKQIEQLKKELKEYEAVEAYMMKTIKEGGSYDDILRAHYREGKVVDGVWVDDEEEEDEEAVWWVYTKDKCNTYEDERWKRGDKWFILRTTMKRSYWTVTGEKPVYHFKDGVCGCCDFEGDGEIEFDSAESDCVEVVGYSDNVEPSEKVAVEKALAKGDFALEELAWKPTGECESFFVGPLIIKKEEPDDSDEEEEEEEECTDEKQV